MPNRPKYKVKSPFEKEDISWVRTLLLFGVKDDEWIWKSSLESYGITSPQWNKTPSEDDITETKKDGIIRGGIRYNIVDCLKLLQEETAFTGKKRQFNTQSYRADKEKYWNSILEVIKKMFLQYSGSKTYKFFYSHHLHYYKKFTDKPEVEYKQFIINLCKQYFSQLLKMSKLPENLSIQELLHQYFLILGESDYDERPELYPTTSKRIAKDFNFLMESYKDLHLNMNFTNPHLFNTFINNRR